MQVNPVFQTQSYLLALAGLSTLSHQAGDSCNLTSTTSTLSFSHIQQKMSFLTKKHISLALSVTELWTSKVDEHLSKTLLKIQVISSCSYWNVFNVPIFSQFNTVLHNINNCLYIAVDSFKLFEKKFHRSFENVQVYTFSLVFFLKGWQPCLGLL